MSSGKLFIFAILALVLAGVLLFSYEGVAVSILALMTMLAAGLAMGLAFRLRTLDRRGEEGLAKLRERIALAAECEIIDEHRCFHISGVRHLEEGAFLIFYRTPDRWLMVSMQDDLSWTSFPTAGLIDAIESEDGERATLTLALRDSDGNDRELILASMKRTARRASLDLRAMRESFHSAAAQA